MPNTRALAQGAGYRDPYKDTRACARRASYVQLRGKCNVGEGWVARVSRARTRRGRGYAPWGYRSPIRLRSNRDFFELP